MNLFNFISRHFKHPTPLTESEIAALDLRFEESKTPGGLIQLNEREANFVFCRGAYKHFIPTRPYQVGWHRRVANEIS